jgi:hypothetical protein
MSGGPPLPYEAPKTRLQISQSIKTTNDDEDVLDEGNPDEPDDDED